jgi:hypothetical protein
LASILKHFATSSPHADAGTMRGFPAASRFQMELAGHTTISGIDVGAFIPYQG